VPADGADLLVELNVDDERATGAFYIAFSDNGAEDVEGLNSVVNEGEELFVGVDLYA
jgi:hypothetical protein